MVQYSSLCENAALSILKMEGRDRVQVECGREEINDGEKQEKNKTRRDRQGQPTNAQTLIMDVMKME